MIYEEIYVLTKHGRFSAEYIETIPVFKRRYFLSLMKKEVDDVKKEQQKSHTHVNRVSGVRKR